MKFNCPKCSQKLQCDDEMAGRVVKCPHCEEKLVIPQTEEPADEMPIEQASVGSEKKTGAEYGASVKKTRSRRSRSKADHRELSDSTNVSMIGSSLIGLGVTVLFYLMVMPCRRFYFGQLFMDRGWVPYVLVLLMGWSMGFLILKTRKLQSQKNALLLDLLPSSLSDEINVETVEAFLEHVEKMPARLRESFMVNRIRKGLAHFAVRHSNPEVASMMMSQSEIDAGAVISSYSVVKVFIWAIPILGFIGTVLGISNAVGGFSGALDQAQDIEVLKNSLNGVTSGLAVAFDTTLVALVMSLMVSFPVSIIQKREEDFLGQVDEYCSENLLKRLDDAGGVADVASHTNVMMQVLGNAMSQNQGDLLKGIEESQERISQVHAKQVEYFKAAIDTMNKQAVEYSQHLEKNIQQMVHNVQSILAEMSQKTGLVVDQQLKTSSRTAEEYQKNVEGLMKKIANSVDVAVAMQIERLSQGLEGLNRVLKDLGEKQVIIQQTPGRRWFGWHRKD